MLVCATAPIDRYIVIDFSSHPKCLLFFSSPPKNERKEAVLHTYPTKVQKGHRIDIGENK